MPGKPKHGARMFDRLQIRIPREFRGRAIELQSRLQRADGRGIKVTTADVLRHAMHRGLLEMEES